MKTLRLYQCCGAGWKFDLTAYGTIIPGRIHFKKKGQAYTIGIAGLREGETFAYIENGKDLGERIK